MMEEIDYSQTNPVWFDAAHSQIELTLYGERVVINAVPGLVHYDGLVAANVPIGEYVPPEVTVPPTDVFVVQMQYKAKVTTQNMIDPSNGFVIWNAVAQVDTRKLSISARGSDNLDHGGFFRAPALIGHVITLQYSNSAGQAQQFTIDAVADKGSWFVLDVTPHSAWGGPFTGNNPLYVVISLRGASNWPPAVPQQLSVAPLDMGQTISERLGG